MISRPLPALLFSVGLCAASPALAEVSAPSAPEAQAANPVGEQKPENVAKDRPAPEEQTPGKSLEKPIEKSITDNHPTSAALTCPPTRPPVYVIDWARLADLTAPDRGLGPEVKAYAERYQSIHAPVQAGIALGIAATLVGGLSSLPEGHWSTFGKWSVGAGLGLVAASALVAWLAEPDRDDFLTLVNKWNLRHPDRPLAP